MNKPHITYEELLELTFYGIFEMNFKGISVNDNRLKKCKPIETAIHKGIYTGSPGKDIYYMLPYLNKDQMNEIINGLENKFPKIPPGNHVNVGAFIRFIYGQFEKKGILRSEQDFERMKNEELDWSLAKKFVDLLYNKLEDNNNYYGLAILCEMKAHRAGDKAVLQKDKEKLYNMEHLYEKAVKYAGKCKSYKHLFTPYYWAFRYFEKFEDNKNGIKYAFLTIKQADKYCPDARPGYIIKLLDCVKYIKKYDKSKYKNLIKQYKNSKNKCVKKVFKKY